MEKQINAPEREHAVMAVLVAIHMVPEGRERKMMVEAMIGFTFRAWGWNVQKFTEELDACKKAVATSRSQLVTGFGPKGLEFEFRTR
jgi:hypothetical protein